jgi:hypothetical protein
MSHPLFSFSDRERLALHLVSAVVVVVNKSGDDVLIMPKIAIF